MSIPNNNNFLDEFGLIDINKMTKDQVYNYELSDEQFFKELGIEKTDDIDQINETKRQILDTRYRCNFNSNLTEQERVLEMKKINFIVKFNDKENQLFWDIEFSKTQATYNFPEISSTASSKDLQPKEVMLFATIVEQELFTIFEDCKRASNSESKQESYVALAFLQADKLSGLDTRINYLIKPQNKFQDIFPKLKNNQNIKKILNYLDPREKSHVLYRLENMLNFLNKLKAEIDPNAEIKKFDYTNFPVIQIETPHLYIKGLKKIIKEKDLQTSKDIGLIISPQDLRQLFDNLSKLNWDEKNADYNRRMLKQEINKVLKANDDEEIISLLDNDIDDVDDVDDVILSIEKILRGKSNLAIKNNFWPICGTLVLAVCGGLILGATSASLLSVTSAIIITNGLTTATGGIIGAKSALAIGGILCAAAAVTYKKFAKLEVYELAAEDIDNEFQIYFEKYEINTSTPQFVQDLKNIFNKNIESSLVK